MTAAAVCTFVPLTLLTLFYAVDADRPGGPCRIQDECCFFRRVGRVGRDVEAAWSLN